MKGQLCNIQDLRSPQTRILAGQSKEHFLDLVSHFRLDNGLGLHVFRQILQGRVHDLLSPRPQQFVDQGFVRYHQVYQSGRQFETVVRDQQVDQVTVRLSMVLLYTQVQELLE